MRHPRWFVATVLAGVLGLAPGGCGFGDNSPREFVQNKYSRATALDLDGSALAYTSPKSPAAVEQAITKDWRPVDRFVHTSGTYLRYSDDIVAVQPHGSGSVVRVESVTTGCPRYRNTVGANWPCDGTGEDDRGGGPGEGK